MRTPITYYGGKQQMTKHILPLIPKHKTYVEPFFGGGAVFFAKQPSEVEVINDKNDLVINFYKVMKLKFNELNELIQSSLHSESLYFKAKKILKGEIEANDIEKAWAFYYNVNTSFAGKMLGGFAFATMINHAKPTNNKFRKFHRYKDRLTNTIIMCRDVLEIIKLFDSRDTFFYLDPPYVSSKQGHYKGYTIDDFKNLLDTLSNIKGKFLLSSYSEDILMEYVKNNGWNRKDIKMFLSADKVIIGYKRRYKTEVLTYNYQVNENLFTSCVDDEISNYDTDRDCFEYLSTE